MALLENDSSAVKVSAANLLSELAGHSAGAKSRLAVGKTTGFSQTPEKVRGGGEGRGLGVGGWGRVRG
jgi:hypothetical protein